MQIRPIDITVTAGTSVIITIPEIYLKKGQMDTLKFCLTKPEIVEFKNATGIEPVIIQNGVNGATYILEDCAGDVFYSDKLLLGFEYRIRFGNNGAIDNVGTGTLGHFINLNTPCCSRGFDPSGFDGGSEVSE